MRESFDDHRAEFESLFSKPLLNVHRPIHGKPATKAVPFGPSKEMSHSFSLMVSSRRLCKMAALERV